MGLRQTIDQSIRSSNYNLNFLSVAAIIIGIVAFVGVGRAIYPPNTDITLVGTSRYLLRYLNATQVLSGDQVLATSFADLPQYNVRITGTKMQDSGYTEYKMRRITQTTTAYFGYLWVNHKFLIVRSLTPIDESTLTYTGTLGVPLGVSKEVYDDVIKEYPEDAANLLPSILYLDSNPTPWFLGIAVELALVVGGAIGIGTAYIRRDPNEHPIIKNLARYGDVDKVIKVIDADMKASKIQRVYFLQFTRNWVIYKAGTDLRFMRNRDVMWMYEQTVTRRSRYGETVNHYLHIYERNGQKWTIDAEHKDVKRMLMALSKQAPWAEVGESAHAEHTWRTDRAEFVRNVDARREQSTLAH